MPGQTETLSLSAVQLQAIEFIIALGNITKAAKAAGVDRRTIHRWMQMGEFRAALKQAESEAMAELRRELLSLRVESVATLRSTMKSRKAAPAVRIRAADIIIRRLLQVTEVADIEERLVALEEAIGEKTRP